LPPGVSLPQHRVPAKNAKNAKNADWIRVDLTKAEHGIAVFCLGGGRHTDTWTH
jgi:hypothetical protein